MKDAEILSQIQKDVREIRNKLIKYNKKGEEPQTLRKFFVSDQMVSEVFTGLVVANIIFFINFISPVIFLKSFNLDSFWSFIFSFIIFWIFYLMYRFRKNQIALIVFIESLFIFSILFVLFLNNLLFNFK